ncbi:MAG TPA: protein kinase [Gemmatimonadaceae bacterium]|nr:protein kinase [Gemmatimonadaceae bacterium]
MAKVCPTCEKEYGDDVLYCSADGATLQSLAPGDDLVGTVVADRYLITDKIGEGGMGRVYLARHVRLPQNVAVKVLHPWLVRDPNVVTRFRREAVNASQIENEHVARVFDHGEIGDGLLYIAMEFVEGKPLGEIVAQNGPLSIARTIEITRQVADALAAAHERPTPIVHRDLKPDNILLGTRRDGSDRVKVVDFGIAEAMSGGGTKLTQAGLVIGTPEYMSPEQLAAITLDWRSDIYSLALVTFYLLTGKLPFAAESPHVAALMRLHERPKTLAEVTNDGTWPPALQAVIDKALAREPGERYATAPEFAHALADAVGAHERPALTPTPAGVAVPTPVPLPATEAKRGRKVAVGSAVMLGVAAVAVAGFLALRNRTETPVPPATVTAPTAPPSTAERDSVAASSPSSASLAASPNANALRPAPPNTVAVVRAPAVGGDTADSSAKSATASPAPSDARASLDLVETMIVRARQDTSRSRVLARAVLDSARAIVPRLESRNDVVEMGVYTVAAYLLLEQKQDACLMLGSIGTEAAQMAKFAAQVRLWDERLDCKE